MRRAAVHVRPATTSDLDVVVELLATLREHGAAGAQRLAVRERLVAVLTDPDRLLLVAVTGDGEVVGTGLLAVGSASVLLDLPAAHLSHTVVAEGWRRRGVGRALVTGATAWAEERMLERVVVNVPPTSREVNRFYARLGFVPVVTRRVAGTAALRRRLGAGDLHSAPDPGLPAGRRRAVGARRAARSRTVASTCTPAHQVSRGGPGELVGGD